MNKNPFEFSAANDLEEHEVIDYYIEDFNYSRFIQSKRNVFLLGERGSGKTMTLLYNSIGVQRRKAEAEKAPLSLSRVGIYVPCNAPLTHRREYELLKGFKAEVLSEHVLVLSIVHALASALAKLESGELLGKYDTDAMVEELEAILGRELPKGTAFFKRLILLVHQENLRTSQAMNEATGDSFYEGALSFASFALPLLETITSGISELAKSHFLLMLDDADYLNSDQLATLNSWIAYRDHQRFSFKVATAKVSQPSKITATGGALIEGHDFTVVDMEKSLHNANSEFGHLSRRIVQRRLERISADCSPEEFFPESPQVKAQLLECKKRAAADADQKYPKGTAKQKSDYVYKMHRALFFRRKPKANLPSYSGFEMIVFLSTGVVRNLLEPCYWMYDKAMSRAADRGEPASQIRSIDPALQNEVIMEQSQRTWDQIEAGLNTQVSGCSSQQAEQMKRLFEALARHFRKRLQSDISEPRATSFTISGPNDADRVAVEELLAIGRKALLVYTRTGTAKEAGSRETYYVPRRMLWPVRGLDPVGQHARAQLKARDLMAAARGEADLPSGNSGSEEDRAQGDLFVG